MLTLEDQNTIMGSNQLLLSLQSADIGIRNEVILKKVSLEVTKGDYLFLIGKTGSGKSSLLKAIYGDTHISKGSARFKTFDLTKLRESELPTLRRKLGIVFQDFRLLDDRNVFDNLDVVLKATGWKSKTDRKNRILETLEKVGISGKQERFIHHLSGGEKQRVAIARALLNDPELIIADEPTGNLDPETALEVMDLLEELHKKGNTVILATHDYRLIKRYNHPVIRCENQEIHRLESVGS